MFRYQPLLYKFIPRLFVQLETLSVKDGVQILRGRNKQIKNLSFRLGEILRLGRDRHRDELGDFLPQLRHCEVVINLSLFDSGALRNKTEGVRAQSLNKLHLNDYLYRCLPTNHPMFCLNEK